jgi:hypothetical protein
MYGSRVCVVGVHSVVLVLRLAQQAVPWQADCSIEQRSRPAIHRHRFVLREREPRINFALNWGGVCCGAQVPVYLPDRISKQLNQVNARVLGASVIVCHGLLD